MQQIQQLSQWPYASDYDAEVIPLASPCYDMSFYFGKTVLFFLRSLVSCFFSVCSCFILSVLC